VSLLAIRTGERRDTWAAFLTLFGLVGSHAILETARDAMFLSKIAPTRLPFVFLAIAALSFIAVDAQSRLGRKLSGRPALVGWTLLGAVATLGFSALSGALETAGLYVLYIWSTVLISIVLVHFWTLVGSVFSITQAKRLYGIIGTGSVLGAIAGSAIATALAQRLPPQKLLIASSVGFALSAAVPVLFNSAARSTSGDAHEAAPGLFSNLEYVRRKPYARHVVVAMFMATACLTVADYLFKTMVVESIPKERLGSFLGGVYLALNVLSLVLQLTLVSWAFKRLPLSSSLAILPALLALGGAGVLLGGGLLAVLFVKGADGGLRYSLHRTASELLFLPFSEGARRRMKAFIDVVSQRGGQVIASFLILAVTSLTSSTRVLAVVLLVLAVLWALTALALRKPYVELFRQRLREGRPSHLDEFPELDVSSLETLIAALDSSRDKEVLAALDLLEHENKVHLIPTLILYHPSERIVVHALRAFARADRKNVVPVMDRLLDHPSSRVRAAILAARSVLQPDSRVQLERLSQDESPEVRATTLVNLIASGDIQGVPAEEQLAAVLEHGTAEAKVALAEAIAHRSATQLAHVLVRLSRADETEVRIAALLAMGRAQKSTLLPVAIDALAEERTRATAERVLLEFGDLGLQELRRALETLPAASHVRWRIPHAMTVFEPVQASASLLSWLPLERVGSVRYQIIRALEAFVRKSAHLALDHGAVTMTIEQTVSRAYRHLDRRALLLHGALHQPLRKTRGGDLLAALLRDKERDATERLFRLLSLAHPQDDFAQIHRGLSGGRDQRATSMELIENILSEPLRSAVLGLVDDAPDPERLARAGRFHEPLGLDYEALLSHLLMSQSEAVQDITVFHIAELGLTEFRERIVRIPNPDGRRDDVVLALSKLGGREGAKEIS
jgi:ATP/ADP translocase